MHTLTSKKVMHTHSDELILAFFISARITVALCSLLEHATQLASNNQMRLGENSVVNMSTDG